MCVRLCLRRKAFLKKLAGHLAQLYCGFSTLDTAMCSCFRWTSSASLAAYLKISRVAECL